MAGKNYTLYLQEHEIEIVRRAGKLMAFHEDSGVLSGSTESANRNAVNASSMRPTPSSAAPRHACDRDHCGLRLTQRSASTSASAHISKCANAEERFDSRTCSAARSFSGDSDLGRMLE